MSSTLTENVIKLVDSLKEDRVKLHDYLDEIKGSTKDVTTFFDEENKYPEFEQPQKFRDALADVSEAAGDAAYVVVVSEEKKAGIIKRFEAQKKGSEPTTQPVHVYSTPAVIQPPGGVMGYFAQRTTVKTQRDIQKMLLEAQRRSETPTISTEERVTDIMAFGRDIIPEFINKTLDRFHRMLCMLHIYNDDKTKWILHQDLGVHMNKLRSIVRGFSKLVVNYRESELNDIKLEAFKGMVEVLTAQMFAGGGAGSGVPSRQDRMGIEMLVEAEIERRKRAGKL